MLLTCGRSLTGFAGRGLVAFCFLLGGSLLQSSPTVAGAAARRQVTTHRFSVDVNAVNLDVVVTDQKGRFVKGLKEEDFAVLEDGVPQELTFFTSGNTPITVLLLLDSSASVRSHQKEVQKDANRFINKLQKGDRARVGLFHNTVVFGPRFTDDMDEHIAMINRMRPQRSTHLYDAVLSALQELAAVPDRKALLVFTDGADEGSKATREDALEAARRSQASVYSIGLVGWSLEIGMNTNQKLLTQIAEYTGGRAFFPQKGKEMRRAFDRIRDELHRTYRIAYFPPQKSDADGAWHSIEVRLVKRKNLVVRTRLGYYSYSSGNTQ
jgi:Ca-activated chloride channel family protein